MPNLEILVEEAWSRIWNKGYFYGVGPTPAITPAGGRAATGRTSLLRITADAATLTARGVD